ncbi:hypothetical protein GCM10008098_24220 [Rhodanobacter panaciterrae]|uniref:Uncharacterized protein n=1 Tax=Rhodanobacter panaciterrae TaxID=490572 RepID=A0ABQ3A278_9GAMM|nr:hypothetical protein [Rhodanobacter panaciterrae]GGY29932.1 hypothetical protein GCM10008098_24220 [Rhodanobacter panaciterrae]
MLTFRATRMLATWTLGALLLFGVTSCFAGEARPISSIYGICLIGFNELPLKVNGPSDVEFASLIYQGRVVAQFRTNILGPEIVVPNDELDRWRGGALILVKSGNDYVGVKKTSYDAYPSVYVSLLVGTHLPRTLSSLALMQGLVSCDLTAPLDVSSPPKIDAGITEAGVF